MQHELHLVRLEVRGFQANAQTIHLFLAWTLAPSTPSRHAAYQLVSSIIFYAAIDR